MQNTPQIVVAREAGACYGVNRALDLVREAAEGEGGPIHTLGPLIHNPTVVAELESKGVGVVESPEEVSGGTIVLRTHGVPPAEEKSAREAADRVLDATCPFVLRAHKAAERLDAEGYQVIVFGEAGHPEVLGTLGHAREPLVIEDPSQLEGVEVGRKVGVVVQTTQSRARLRELVCALLGRADEVRVIDTICEATSLRQAAAAELAGRADVMVVIGGRNSANTCRLAQICGESCARVHHIEVAGELEASNFEGAETIGVTAGASTPQAQIDEVCERICELSGGELAPEGER
ncbi:4-hydroxy-3-methylbut-2-enyl diphosphate reductase [Olsenella intestinalis]|uniref:4-hydroxy-3-methylbut-2-enyl diphosphate reductase n=1 Tax=Olsenella intestinalis TaxID=2930083 RepID=UPI00200E81C1|nr:4-hydroxy-3-methylbut-2-enyl diphosphate reductase [Olsenella intestinalis]